MLREGPFVVRRLGRFLLWRYPSLYRWVGVIRERGDCLKDGFEVWIGGYPRSANTFALAAFKLANPTVALASHFHIPAFIIHGLQCEKPGIFLIRRPEDSVVSWTIYWEGRMRLEDSLDYYIDFHRCMSPYLGQLFVAPFAQTTTDFENLIRAFNARFAKSYAALPMDPAARTRCISYVEDFVRGNDGSLNEFTVSRPSAKRNALKHNLLVALWDSPRLSRKLKTAEALYEQFRQGSMGAAAACKLQPVRKARSEEPNPQ